MARAAARSGRRVVGFVGDDMPVALILAAGALPVRLRGDAGCRAVTRRPLPRSLIRARGARHRRAVARGRARSSRRGGLRAQRRQRRSDSITTCASCSAAACAADPRPLLFDVASLARPTSFEHTLDSTRRARRAVGTSQERASSGRAARRAARRAVGSRAARVARCQRRCPAAPRGHSTIAAGCDWRDDFDDAARQWLSGTACSPCHAASCWRAIHRQTIQLHLAVEACGASVVLELTESTRARAISQRRTARRHRRRIPRGAHRPALCDAARWRAGWPTCARDHRADAVRGLAERGERGAAMGDRAPGAARCAMPRIPALLLTRQPLARRRPALKQVKHFVRDLGKTA